MLDISVRLILAANYKSDEHNEAVCKIDGTRLSNDTNDSLVHFNGDGNGGSDMDSGWLTEQFQLPLSEGPHTIVVGACNNDATANDEDTEAFFDDIVITIGGT